jgi:hypothetical protein
MSVHTSHLPRRRPETNGEAFAKAAVLLLGLLVGTLAIVAVLLWADARQAREDGSAAAAPAPAAAHNHATDHNTALPLSSFAGVVPPNAQELAKAHKPYDATLPPVSKSNVVKVHMTLKDMPVDIAPGSRTTRGPSMGTALPGRWCTFARVRPSR